MWKGKKIRKRKKLGDMLADSFRAIFLRSFLSTLEQEIENTLNPALLETLNRHGYNVKKLRVSITAILTK